MSYDGCLRVNYGWSPIFLYMPSFSSEIFSFLEAEGRRSSGRGRDVGNFANDGA